jgi:uncharacterized membrane protein YkoI
MKINMKKIVCGLAGVAILALGLTGCASEKKEEGEAKVTRAQAEQTALARVPGGTIKEGELEKEGGRMIWSFDITKPGAAGTTEVNVDATTGEVVSAEHEGAK